MTKELILRWLNMVYKRWLGTLLCRRRVGVSIRGHMIERVKAKFNEDSGLIVIHGRITRLVQSLDGVVNWPLWSLSCGFTTSRWQPWSVKWGLVVEWSTCHFGQYVNGSLQHNSQFFQNLWRKVSKLVEFSMKRMGVRISCSVYIDSESASSDNGSDSSNDNDSEVRNMIVNCWLMTHFKLNCILLTNKY
jgi:hypothetical protein